MKKITFLMLFTCFLAALSTAQSIGKFARVKIDLTGKNIADLAALGIETDHGTYAPGQFLTTILSETELATVKAQGFATETLIPDMQAWHRAQADRTVADQRNVGCANAPNGYATPVNYTYGTMAGYYKYQEMLDILDDMVAKYPNLISPRAIVSDSITTHEGRPQWWVRVSDNPNVDEPEPEVLYTALHHAREPNSLSQMIFYLWYLLEHYDTDPTVKYILDNEELYFIPCVNPDGYLYNEFTNPDGYGYWRKNRRDNGDGTFGVDLNRNYGYQWGFNDTGSSPNPGGETYRGPAGFSEPETRMVRDFCLQHNFTLAFNYHTFSNLLIYPWGYSDALAEQGLAQLAQLFTRENNFKAGVATETVGYYVNGTSDDWMYGETGAFAYTPEAGPSEYGFWPPQDAIDGLNKANMWQNLSMALCALQFGEATDKSPTSFALQNFDLPFELRRYGFQDGAFTVSLTPLTSNVASVSAPQTFNLQQFENATGSFAVSLSANAQAGQAMRFLLTLESGGFVHTDTLNKALNGSEQVALLDHADDLDNWSAGSWNTTTEQFVSPPSSLTDSPNSEYFANDYNALVLNEAVPIPANAVNPQLRFFARWAIEEDYDFLVIQGAGNDGLFLPLCGLYTTPGSDLQLPGQPVYDGFQTNWVEERISLADYVGQNFNLEFDMISNFSGQYDGFYLDDLRIEYSTPINSGTVSIPLEAFRLQQNQPNPASGRTTISWDNPSQIQGTAILLVFNALGEKMTEKKVDLARQNYAVVDTKNWAEGLYSYQLRTGEWQSKAMKLVVVR